MEFMGEIFADFFGLNQSKFQWIIDQKAREDEAAARKARRRREQQDAVEYESVSTLEQGAKAE